MRGWALRWRFVPGCPLATTLSLLGPSAALPLEVSAQGSWIVQLVPGASSAAEGFAMARVAGGQSVSCIGMP